MVTLADAGQGKGHIALFTAAIDWLETSRTHVLEKALHEKTTIAFENVTSLLRYMCDLLQGLGFTGSRTLTPPWEDDVPPEFDEYIDELAGDDDESVVEDSDEDSLGTKLCTYSVTQKEFMNQHWYHCYTCKMVDGVGVCSVCARVCHKNHDISYAKYGNFFCDCGAKEDGSCQALSKRLSNGGNQEQLILGVVLGSSIASSALDTTLSLNITIRSKDHNQSMLGQRDVFKTMERALQMAKQIEVSKEALLNADPWKSVVRSTLEFFENLMPAIKDNCAKYSTVGCHLRAKNALERLHQPDKTFAVSDQIMVATLGSQEGAFENVRSNYAGEQAQTIRQLVATNLIRRVGLCCLSSPHGKRQHLAVSHEKGKVTILQLSALLKQADAAKKKLTLSRLAAAPIPCTIMSLASNPANEDLLAVCGLKECHILTFTGSGAASDHIVITPQLETGNFIKRAVWLPGSQTMLAIITCDYVKIYELSDDIISPQYYFVVPMGKIRDCTFVYQSGTYYLLLFASSGYIYTQPLIDESLAKHGAFYVTNTLEIDHPMIYETKAALCDGGASIYYSHLLQMLFFSYLNGRNFMAPLTDVNAGVKCVMLLTTGQTTKSSSSSSKVTSQALMQWTEVPGHPGLIFAMMNQSNNPVVFMLKPDGVLVQEIKYSNAKSKIMDMVAIRHTTAGQERTTLLLLCEDGSLRIFAANAEYTNFWLSPEVQPISNQLYQSYQPKSMRRTKKSGQKINQGNNIIGGNTSGTINKTGSNSPNFPVDFFEHCNFLSEIEFGGNDFLQIYNTQQLKHRLNSSNLYVVSTKSTGFTLDIINNEPNIVLTGIRISVGNTDVARSPSTISINGRIVNLTTSRQRWFDIPMTREESLLSDKKLSLVFGPSADENNVTILDYVRVYGKTKDIFGWPEETEDTLAGGANGTAAASSSNGQPIGQSVATGTTTTVVPTTSTANTNNNETNLQSITALDKMITSMLEVLDSGLGLLGGTAVEADIKRKSMEVATVMLLYPLPNVVQTQAKCVLATLLGNRIAYNAYKDKEILNEVDLELTKLKTVRDIKNIDPEAFFRLVVLTRSIAIARPHSLTKICADNKFTIVPALMELVSELYAITPNYELQSSIVKIGLSHTEATVHCLIEIIYAFALSDPQSIDSMTKFFVQLLLDKSPIISHSAKHAMIRLLRPRTKRRRVPNGSTPVCSTPTTSINQGPQLVGNVHNESNSSILSPDIIPGVAVGGDDFAAAAAGGIPDIDIDPLAGLQGLEAAQMMYALAGAANAGGAGSVAGAANGSGAGGYPLLIDLHQDADDEAIMEIAIALSLQEHENDTAALHRGLANIQNARGRALQRLQSLGNGAASGASGSGSVSGSGAGNFNK